MNGIPITNLYYKKSKKTLITAKSMLEEMGNLFVNKNLGRVAIRDEIENLVNYENLGTYHHMGGTRIGENKKDSVVDSNLKLHNSKNLFITGSSVFTTGGYANPTYTIVKLSLRLADELDKQLKKIS
jgi:choline dehydrogenase-like flavoprotein